MAKKKTIKTVGGYTYTRVGKLSGKNIQKAKRIAKKNIFGVPQIMGHGKGRKRGIYAWTKGGKKR